MPISKQLPIEKIIRENRRTISIRVTDNATIIIKAPRHATQSDIDRALASHLQWINDRLHRASEKKQWTDQQFVDGKKLLYLGKVYQLKIIDNQAQPLILKDNNFLLSKKYQPRAREIFEQWYRRQASELFHKRARIYATLMGVSFNRLRLSSARTRWGSCSSNGNINIVWRLIMAPQFVIDYVIVHELAHLRHMNHSAAFWRLVGSVYPDYEQARQWLKQYGHFLNI
jgi:predicted metal-dependent hydrolase